MTERDLLDAILELTQGTRTKAIRIGIGDDAAVWQPSRSHRSVISSDMLIDDVHFRADITGAAAIGHKALAVNLSDLAAMGARPVLATVALGLPKPLDGAWVREFYQGLSTLAERTKIAVVGGDLSAAPRITICVTVVGEVRPTRLALRSGARPKDILAVTGPLGVSRAGRAVLDAQRPTRNSDEEEVLAVHLRPDARLREGQFLAASAALHALLDLSDGIAADLPRLLQASKCGAVLQDLPTTPAATAVAQSAGARITEWAMSGGEDYELLAAIAPRNFPTVARSFKHRFGRELLPIGSCTETLCLREIDSNGQETPLMAKGWDHFETR